MRASRPVGGPYLVLDSAVCLAAGNAPADVAESAVRAGFGLVQLRDKSGDVRALLQLTLEVADRLDGAGRLVVNDRVDVVRAARERGARVDGVHLGQSDLPCTDARRVLGRRALVGVSVSRPEHLAEAQRNDVVDYLGVGPVLSTRTKLDADGSLGWHGLASTVQSTSLPVIAIGGLSAKHARAVRRAGATGFAVVSAVCAARDPGRAAAVIVAAWSEAEAPPVAPERASSRVAAR